MMNVASAYSTWSATYDTDRNLTRHLDGVVTRTLIGPTPIPMIVEAGCGTGKNTRYFADLADHVHALDFSSGMLDVARTNVSAPNVQFHQTDLTGAWPCRSGTADLVAFNLVLEHVEALDGVFGEAARVLRPGGQVLVSELHPFKQYQGSQARFAVSDGSEHKVAAFVHNVSDYLSAAAANALRLVRLNEWWHPDEHGGVPRLLTLILVRNPGSG